MTMAQTQTFVAACTAIQGIFMCGAIAMIVWTNREIRAQLAEIRALLGPPPVQRGLTVLDPSPPGPSVSPRP